MINEYNVKRYCCDDVSLIENYEQAINDLTEMWDCHHRLGIIISKKQLKDIGAYYDRPAIELIFFTSKQHRQIHMSGEKHYNYGKHLSEETRRKLSILFKGKYFGEKSTQAKPVNQIDKNTGEIIKTWSCIREVNRELGIGHINKCCKGKRKTAGGFVWRYVN